MRPERSPSATAGLSASASRIVDAIAEGRCGGLFPSVGTDIGGYVAESRRLGGHADAAYVAATLAAPRFAPVPAALDEISRWCEAANAAHPGRFAPGVLDLGNDALFGPIVRELFTVCAAGRLPEPGAHGRMRLAGWLSHLDRFLNRLDDDGLGARFGLRGPVVSLTAHGDETHNGARLVLRVACAEGLAVAYKERPPTGEALFVSDEISDGAPVSVFGLLNSLTGAAELELPTLRCLQRRDADGTWLWQEWIDSGPRRPVPSERGLTVAAPVLGEDECPLFWTRAGALTAAAVAFGIGDLLEGNVFAGRRPGEPVRYYAVDLEVFARPVRVLEQTGLTAGADSFHHVGFENEPRLCTADPPAAYLREGDDGLEVVRLTGPWVRRDTDTVVSDSAGRFGYGPYLPHFIRGAFDLWAAVCENRERIAGHLRARRDSTVTRVLTRHTGDYVRMLVPWLLEGRGLPGELADSERRQLEAGDVPYFYAVTHDERLYTVDGPVDDPKPSSDQLDFGRFDGGSWDLGALGVVLRDAIAFAGPDAARRGAGVRVGGSEVAVDWPEPGARVVYWWNEETVHVKAVERGEPETAAEIGDLLCRIGTADAVMRDAWVRGGRADADLGRRLGELTGTAVTWLESVVDEHGWPVADLVGEEAADAAVLLLQHAEGALEFRWRCLRELEAAARRGAAPSRAVAYVTDALCVAEGRPQRYGTKFERRGGSLVPYRLADPDGVDAARAAMGLGPLAEYAAVVEGRFGRGDGHSCDQDGKGDR